MTHPQPGRSPVHPPATPPGRQPGQPPVHRHAPPLADWLDRVAAALVDSAVQNWPQLIGFAVLLATLEQWAPTFGGKELTRLWLPTWPGLVAVMVGSLVAMAIGLWNRVFLQGRTGQSLGKRTLDIRLIGESTLTPPDIGQVFLRELCHMLDAYSYVGYLWPLWDARRRTFADMIMRTVVVRASGTAGAVGQPGPARD